MNYVYFAHFPLFFNSFLPVLKKVMLSVLSTFSLSQMLSSVGSQSNEPSDTHKIEPVLFPFMPKMELKTTVFSTCMCATNSRRIVSAVHQRSEVVSLIFASDYGILYMASMHRTKQAGF